MAKGKPAKSTTAQSRSKPAPVKTTPAPVKTTPAPVKTEDPGDEFQDVSKAQTVLGTLSARYPVLTEEDLTAFGALVPPAKCAELGSRTRAAGVLGEGVKWAVTMNGSMQTYPNLLKDYHPKRFAYLLFLLAMLAKTIQSDEAKRGRKGTAKGSTSAAKNAALEARRSLLQKMKSFAGERDEERAEILRVQGKTDTDDNLSKSMVDLAKQAKSWLDREDRTSQILREAAGLDQAAVDTVLQFARALTTASAGESMTSGGRPQDSPEANLIEGKILAEMKEAMGHFARANAKNKVVPRLVPGPATRHVLGRRQGAAGSEAQEEEEPAPEAAGTGAP